jgi:predicted DNA binding CopG/RHH family protein
MVNYLTQLNTQIKNYIRISEFLSLMLKVIPNFKKEAKRYQESARETLRKNKRVNIRMTERDLVRIQKKAIEEGLPYQTLISSVLHKYINGHLVEKVS